MKSVPPEGSGSNAGNRFLLWLQSERCSIHQSVVLKMLLPLLQFGRDYRQGTAEHGEDPGQRTAMEDPDRWVNTKKHNTQSHSWASPSK